MLPRFSKVKQRTEAGDSVLLNMSWGTLVFGITISRKQRERDFENSLYPHQGSRNFIAILCMVLVHLLLAYFLLFHHNEKLTNPEGQKGQLVFLDLQNQQKNNKKQKIAKIQPEKKPPPHRFSQPITVAKARQPAIESPPTTSPVAAPIDTMSQIEAARERRRALEAEAAQQNYVARIANNAPSEDEIAMVRIKANIQAANYNRKGTNGIFQILNKGVQTGRFSFRGWTNDPRESTRQTFEVDAGVGGDVERAMIRRMIELIREHYSGDFNWDSHRLNRVVVLSARQADTAQLEAFMMKEFFATK